jgi:hypothetical protein
MGRIESDIETLFTHAIQGHPRILELTTGHVSGSDPDVIVRSFEALTIMVAVQREAILRLAREIDDLEAT